MRSCSEHCEQLPDLVSQACAVDLKKTLDSFATFNMDVLLACLPLMSESHAPVRQVQRLRRPYDLQQGCKLAWVSVFFGAVRHALTAWPACACAELGHIEAQVACAIQNTGRIAAATLTCRSSATRRCSLGQAVLLHPCLLEVCVAREPGLDLLLREAPVVLVDGLRRYSCEASSNIPRYVACPQIVYTSVTAGMRADATHIHLAKDRGRKFLSCASDCRAHHVLGQCVCVTQGLYFRQAQRSLQGFRHHYENQ